MRRFLSTLAAASVVLIAAAGPAAADVQKLAIKDPGWVGGSVCSTGPTCTFGTISESNQATIEVVIKCPSGEIYTLFVTVKQDTGEGTNQTGGECSGEAQRRLVSVYSENGYFHPGRAKAKASAFSDPGAAPIATAGVFEANVDKRITLVQGPPPCC